MERTISYVLVFQLNNSFGKTKMLRKEDLCIHFQLGNSFWENIDPKKIQEDQPIVWYKWVSCWGASQWLRRVMPHVMRTNFADQYLPIVTMLVFVFWSARNTGALM